LRLYLEDQIFYFVVFKEISNKSYLCLSCKSSDKFAMPNISIPKIVAVTVTYNIEASFQEALESYLGQVEQVIIVDNSTQRVSRERLIHMAQDWGERVNLIRNDQNLGLARAQNMGITVALEQDADWILMMDDDSLAGPEMVVRLIQAMTRYRLSPKTRILVPRYQEQAVKRKAKYVTSPDGRFRLPRFAIEDFSRQPVVENLFIAISSGSLIQASLFREIGMIRESFNIDYLDVDFCLRAIAHGDRIAAVGDALLQHHLGAQTEHRLLGWRFWAWNHPPKRRFTIYRNRTRLWREYLFRFPGFILYDMLASLQDLFRILAFERHRSKKLAAALKGAWRGLLGTY
jgi:rhamnosyltransferase